MAIRKQKTYTYDFADNIMTETHVITGANGVKSTTRYTYDLGDAKKMSTCSSTVAPR
ncbi:MAG: hypothetical protein IPJ13_32025 [Saprospiraceae bacterium]|nr:hypothetical protein [Saprospiraceae bacterium]